MSSTNFTIVFEATESLVSGVTSGDDIQLDMRLTKFDESNNANKKVNTMMSGRMTSVKFYTEQTWSISVMDSGLVTFFDTTTISLSTEYMEMFFASVANSEQFTITNLDKNDVEIDVQLTGNPSRQRKSAAWVDKFDYSFNVRKVL